MEIEGKFKNVFYVKNLRYNLLSIPRLEESGLKTVFHKGKVLLIKNGKVLAVGNGIRNLYKIIFELNNKVQANAFTGYKEDAEIWHKWFGHF